MRKYLSSKIIVAIAILTLTLSVMAYGADLVGDKSEELISGDGKHSEYVLTDADSNIQLVVKDTATMKETAYKLNDDATQVLYTEWLGNEKVGMEIHITPRLNLYRSYNIADGKLVDEFYGYDFAFNKEKTDVFYVFAPVNPDGGMFSLLNGKKTLYKTDKANKISSGLFPSNDFKKVAFFESNIKNEKKSALVILTIKDNKVTGKKKISLNKPEAELTWKDSKTLLIEGYGKYDLKSGKLIRN